MMSFEVGFELGEKKESHEAKSGLYGGWGKRCDIVLSQKFPHIGQILRDQFHTNFSHVQIFRNDSVNVRFR